MKAFPVAMLCIVLGVAAPQAGQSAGPALPWHQEDSVRHIDVGNPGAKVRLAYTDRGEGPVVLLIHGFGAHTYTWRHIAPLLAARHRIVALDLKGFGQSDKPLDDNYAMRDQATLVDAFMDALGLDRVTLVGHSFGGGVALMLALDELDGATRRIERLVLLDSVAYRQNIPIFLRLLQRPGLAQFGMAVVPTEVQTRLALRLAYHDNSLATYEDALAYAQPLKSPEARHALIRTVQQIVPDNIDEMAARYGEIPQPALIVWCEHDRIVPLEVGWRLHGALPNSRFHMLRECGHMPQEEKPHETARLIQDFLAQ